MKDVAYAACFCEENIWHLCADDRLPQGKKEVLWIGGAQYNPLWCQRGSDDPDMPVWWDYHVILLVRLDTWQVWDLDTTLPLPVDADVYFSETFRQPGHLVFRLMDSVYYRDVFSSDRSHMKDAGDHWLAVPPAWPAIDSARPTFAEMRDFSDMSHGELYSLAQLRRRLAE